jgi:hypothetical protein
MKRNNNDDRIRWKKIGGGTLYHNGKAIGPGSVFRAYPHEIPENFRDSIVPLDALPDDTVKVQKPAYQVVPKPGAPGWYNVVDAETGKVLNEKSLRPKQAQELLEELI